jgi:hypothetical protein
VYVGISVAAVKAADAYPVSLVSQFGTATAVVDEPVADLCHTDARCLKTNR